jgi:hypothetical protein
MARYPGAAWRPITVNKSRKALTVYNRVNLHSTASSANSQYGYFNQSGIPDSHFHVAYDGTVEQYVDTSMRAFADLEGNDATISIETAGVAKDGNEKWRAAQLASIVKLVAWCMKTHPIPRKLATTAFAGSSSSQGLSWHRLGCDGNFPSLPSIQAGRNQRGGGMRYTKHFGKICPGYGRVTQIHQDVWPGVQRLLDGGSPETVPQKTEEGFLMALSSAAQDELKEKVDDIYSLLAAPIKDGTGAAPPRDIAERTLNVARRVLAGQVADAAVPVEVDVDANDVADALIERLSAPVAQAVADALAARLAF